jgi:prepilin-type N-terminal cleavage/methylation domain-containing protein
MQENRGFSLVEMSVVLVVVGLIVVGIVAGSSMMYGAKLRNVMSEYDRLKEGVEIFEEQYKYYPGDFNEASDYWENAQNGNGDWAIEGDSTERLYAWNHMVLANVIEGGFTGEPAEDAPAYRPNVNLPGSVFTRNHYMIGTSKTGTKIFGRQGTFIQYTSNDSPTSPWGGALSPKDAQYIDEKIDDGVAFTGMVFGVDAIDAKPGSCSAGQVDVGVDYNLLKNKAECRVVLWLDEE